VNAEVVQLGPGHVGKALLRAFEICRERAKQSGGCVATKGKVKMGEEDDMVNSETKSALGGTREILNKVDRSGELINQFCGHRGQVYPEAEGKQAG